MTTNGARDPRPWDLAAECSLTDLLAVGDGPTKSRCKWRTGKVPIEESDPLDAAAWLIAELAMRLRCGETDKFPLWRACAIGDAQPTKVQREALEAFIAPSFGLPSSPGSDEHLQGAVAEHVWYQLTAEAVESDRKLRRLEEPDMYVTSPGGDGLAIYADGDGLSFRLWEIKKSTGTSGLSSTVQRAYGQLVANATRYLAQYTATGQRFADHELKAFYAQLVDLWVAGSAMAGAGVSVATSHEAVPKRCFSTMHKYFSSLDGDGQLEGLVTGLGDFGQFAAQSRMFLWSAL